MCQGVGCFFYPKVAFSSNYYTEKSYRTMDDDNQNPPPSRPYRVRRQSSSTISSTTSPGYPMVPLGHIQAPSPLSQQHRNGHLSHSNSVDDDVQPSSSSSFPRPARHRGSSRASSPLGSPDSTAYWGSGASPSPHTQSSSSSYRSPATPGGLCVVSSSTVDDVPQSPFSPSEILQSNSSAATPAPPEPDEEDILPPPPPPLPPPAIPGPSRLMLNPPPVPDNNIEELDTSPLRNKMKKASSFERFSQAQAASNNAAGSSSTPSNNSSNNPSNSSVSASSSFGLLDSPSTSSSVRLLLDSLSSSRSNLLANSSISTDFSSHIKIPSKKLAAKLASVFEQEQLLADQNQNNAASSNNNPTSNLVSNVHSSNPGPSSTNNNNNLVNQILLNEETAAAMMSSMNHENLIRELSESPLNLTETVNPAAPMRGVTIHKKKIPLPPKQKLLHRMQSGELLGNNNNGNSNVSSGPNLQQQPPSPPPQLILNSLQSSNNSTGGSLQDNLDNGGQIPSSQQFVDPYPYDAFLRRDDFSTSAANSSDPIMGSKTVIVSSADDQNNSGLYDSADAYAYYYNNLLGDEIFNSGGGSNPRGSQSQTDTPGVIIDPSGQSHNSHHLEYVLGGIDDNPGENSRPSRDDQTAEFLDPNEELAAVAAAKLSANDSTLRNLLMMEPIRNLTEESWAALASEYQNRMNNSGGNNSVMSSSSRQWNSPNNLTSGGTMSALNNGGNVQDWRWSQQCSEQDEVMDMSIIDTAGNNNSTGDKSSTLHKRLILHPGPEDDSVDLPMLNTIQTPLDLQQPLNLLQAPGNSSNNSLSHHLPQHHHHHSSISSQQHNHRGLILSKSPVEEDQPVNLRANSILLDQSSHNSSSNVTQGYNLHEPLPLELNHKNHHHSSSANMLPHHSSYSLQIHAGPSEPPQDVDMPNNTNSMCVDNMDERRIIRVNKYGGSKSNVFAPTSNSNNGPRPVANIIEDKPVQPKSFASLPSPLQLVKIGDEYAITTAKDKVIHNNTRFGPVEGPLKKAYAEDLNSMESSYPCLVMADRASILWQLDRSDDQLCNWMKFVRLAKCWKEQNILISESDDGLLYFTSCCEIGPKTELKVGYELEYAHKYGLPYLMPGEGEDSSSNDKDENISTRYPCFECEKEFPTTEELNGHLKECHEDPIVIPKKKKKKVKKAMPAVAVQEKKKENVINSQKPPVEVDAQPPPKVKCTMCYKSFATKERLDKHMIVHSDEESKPLKCNFCPKRFLTNSALAGHMKTHAEEGKCFECPMCKFATQQLLQLKEHVQTHRSRETNMFHCPHCPKKFSMYSVIRKHIRAFHGPKQYACDTCVMRFPTLDKLRLHKLKHSDHREFLCQNCGRQFKRKDKMREHIKRVHEQARESEDRDPPEEPAVPSSPPRKSSKMLRICQNPEDMARYLYKCVDCAIGFKRRGMLVNHLAKKHPEKAPDQVPELTMPIMRPARNYFCLYCDRVYKSSSKRKSHILKAHPGKPVPELKKNKETIARFDQLSETNVTNAVKIVQTVTDDGGGTFKGEGSKSLGGRFVNKIREAVVGKVIASPHACQWCHRQYATRAKLLQHQRKAHLHLMPPEIQTPRTQKNNRTPVPERLQVSRTVVKCEQHEPHTEPSSKQVIDPAPIMESNRVYSSSTSEPSSSQNETFVTTTTNPSQSVVESSSSSSSVATISGVPVPLHGKDGNVIGFLLTTTGVADIDSLSEVVMLPVQNLTSDGVTVTIAGGSNSPQQPHHELVSVSVAGNSNNDSGDEGS